MISLPYRGWSNTCSLDESSSSFALPGHGGPIGDGTEHILHRNIGVRYHHLGVLTFVMFHYCTSCGEKMIPSSSCPAPSFQEYETIGENGVTHFLPSVPPFANHHCCCVSSSTIVATKYSALGSDRLVLLLVCHGDAVWGGRAIDKTTMARKVD